MKVLVGTLKTSRQAPATLTCVRLANAANFSLSAFEAAVCAFAHRLSQHVLRICFANAGRNVILRFRLCIWSAISSRTKLFGSAECGLCDLGKMCLCWMPCSCKLLTYSP